MEDRICFLHQANCHTKLQFILCKSFSVKTAEYEMSEEPRKVIATIACFNEYVYY